MSCHLSYIYGTDSRVIVRGSRPRSLTSWTASAWFVVNGQKHTHTAKFEKQDISGVVQAIGALIDSLIEDNGNEVTGCGWQAFTRG